ncbi:hypothetical protein L915_13751, partial [Phytophthora nicotianae]
MAVDECIASIMYYQSLQERRFMDDVYKKVNIQHFGYDREMTLVANLVSEHACELIHDQYVYALGRASYTFSERSPGVFFVKSTCADDDALDEVNTEYTVTKLNWTCSCLFMSTCLLPCRHVFFLRRALEKETVIPTQLLNRRWLLSSVRSSIEFENANDTSTTMESFAIRRVLAADERPWDSNRKYREALPIATTICDSMAGLGMVQYREAMAYLKYVARRFKNGEYNISSSYLPPEEQQSELTLPPTQLERDQPHGAGADVVSENAPVDSNSLSVGTGSQSVEPVSQSGESGTQSGESGTQSGESGTQSGESGTQSGESGTQSGFEPQIALATLPQANDVFEVASPPRSRGRPKQAARSKKEARRKNVQTVQDDSNLYAANLSLANVQDAVEGEPTYKESAAILSRFKLFEFSKKPRAPVAHNKLSLSPAKNITPVRSITQIFPKDLIERCNAKVSTLQKKHRDSSDQNLAEQDIAVELIGIGTYATETLGVMKKWHRAMKSIQYVEKAISWIETIDFTLPMPQAFRAESDPDMIPKLKAIPLLSVQ